MTWLYRSKHLEYIRNCPPLGRVSRAFHLSAETKREGLFNQKYFRNLDRGNPPSVARARRVSPARGTPVQYP